jgi:hypothetical protein
VPKGNHHYVPVFYLAHFASQPRRINICNLRTEQFYKDGSLRDQCYGRKLHGDTDELEDVLGDLEGIVAPTVSGIVERNQLPQPGSVEMQKLMFFIALQTSRTPTNAGSMAEGFNKMLRLAKIPEDLTDDYGQHAFFQLKDAVRMSIETSLAVSTYWSDLSLHLVVNTGRPLFVTSDNPSVVYNQYYEHLKGRGTTGAIKKGLMIFVPISPTHVILLYDGEVYKVGQKRESITYLADPNDLVTLNTLQVANADTVLLFSDWNDVGQLKALLQRAKKYRRPELSNAVEFVSDNNSDSLFQIYPIALNIHLKLSFLYLRRDAKRVPPRQRGLQNRRSHSNARDPAGYPTTAERERFVRKDLGKD